MQAALNVSAGMASRPCPGEIECGDQGLILAHAGVHLVALADGLGHGPEAAAAAKAAVAAIAARPGDEVGALLAACHRELAHTRGVALTVMRFDPVRRRATCAGVGNVEVACVCRARTRPLTSPGVVGARIRKIIETEVELAGGDLFVLHTDGISSRFDPASLNGMDAGVAARRLLATHAKEQDDAACIVVRV